ncbi:MAG: calycin-like domain-containing protein [Bacteroidales bacterium]|nr:calycin-like domain-containing protein [Bacteroidales bacterium]
MKKIFTLALSALLALPSLYADNDGQLPNYDFEGDWETCYPHNASGYQKAVGENPKSWCISNVAGVSKSIALKGQGATKFGEKTTGYNSSSAVLVYNGTAGIGTFVRKVPGYFTLGTTWNTAEGFDETTHDGGTFGGLSFTNRPDAISFYYQRTLVDDSSEAATMVVYLWKGSWTQINVPGDITTSTATTSGTMTIVNRDRAVLDKMDESALGGTTTKSDDAELIASKEYLIEGAASDWTNCVQEIDYATTSTPEMINVIFAANNYFDRALATPDNKLAIDDVKLLYYSQLKSLSVGGEAVPDFAEDVYEYTLSSYLPDSESDITYTLKGKSGTATVVTTLDPTTNTAVLTVCNAQGTDAEGKASHVYTLKFAAKPATSDNLGGQISYDGTLIIKMGGKDGDLLNANDVTVYTVYVDPASEVGKCTFTLKNFILDLGDGPISLGDIVIEDATYFYNKSASTITYTGTKEGLSLAEGEIIADCELTGEQSGDTAAHFVIDVAWKDALGPGVDITIYVEFNGLLNTGVKGVAVDVVEGEVEYYNLQGIRIANPQAGQIVIRRQGAQATKIRF